MSIEVTQDGLSSPAPAPSESPKVVVDSAQYLDEVFRYHPPRNDQLPKYDQLRREARHFADTIHALVPAGADRTAALRKLREVVMTCNAAIALDGLNPPRGV